MHPPVDLARRRLLATFGVGVAATLAGVRLDPQVGAQQPLRLVLLVPEDALPPDRISSVVDAVRLAIADGNRDARRHQGGPPGGAGSTEHGGSRALVAHRRIHSGAERRGARTHQPGAAGLAVAGTSHGARPMDPGVSDEGR